MKLFPTPANAILQPKSFSLLKNRSLAKYFSDLLLLMLAVCFSNAVHAQTAPLIQWEKSLGGSAYDVANSIQQTTDGGFIVAGYSNSNDSDVSGNHGNNDYWIVKLNAHGNITWQKSLGGSSDDVAFSIQQTTDSGYIVAGYSESNDGDVSGNHGDADYWIVRLDANGNIVWQKSLGGSNEDYAYSIQQTTDGGFVVAGYSTSNDGNVSENHGGYDFWVVRLDANGNITWQKALGGSNDDAAFSIQQTTDGGFIVAGSSFSNDGDVSGNHGDFDYWLVKLDANGNMVWQKSLGGSSYDIANSIQQTIDGGFIVAGYSESNDGDVSGNHGNDDYWVVKLDANGNITWQKPLGGSNDDAAFSVQQTTDDGFIVAGYSYSNDGDVSGNHGYDDYWIVKLDANRNITWQESLGGSEHDYASSVQQTKDSGFIVAGSSLSNNKDVSGNHGIYDYWIVKLAGENQFCLTPSSFLVRDVTSTSVELKWDEVMGAKKYKLQYEVSATNDWTVLYPVAHHKTITGLLPNTAYTWQVKTICKTDSPAVVSEWSPRQHFTTPSSRLNDDNKQNKMVFQLCPNPSSGVFTIHLQTGEAITTSATIEILNAVGQTIYTSKEMIVDGVLQKEIQLNDAATGMYLVRVTSSDRVYTSQINLQK